VSFLSCSNLCKTYADGTEAVKGIDLRCDKGTFVVLLGPSGCGKTTTLRMFAGLERPTSGKIMLDGEDVALEPPGARDVGFVFQFYALYPHMNVRDNIAFPLESMGVKPSERRRRVDAVLERLDLHSLALSHPGRLSGGDQQRVALARAMVRQPRLNLMDEPLGTLDAERRGEMRQLIRTQQLETGTTTVYVTHDQDEAMHLADLIVVMEGGRIRQVGTPEAVYERPANLFVAHFIGSPGMNFIRGRWGESGDFLAADVRFLGLGQKPTRGDAAKAEAKADEMVLGVRPEYVFLDDGGPLRGEVVLDEYLGSCRNVHIDTDCGRLVARLEHGAALSPGTPVGLSFVPGQVRFFFGDSGEAYADAYSEADE
jgi:multiple sugar transport system ATP-binding protein